MKPCGHTSVDPKCLACRVFATLANPITVMRGSVTPSTVAIPRRQLTRTPCKNLGAATGETRRCPTCTGEVDEPLYECSVHKVCTKQRLIPSIECCRICKEYAPVTETPKNLKWAYGVTTVPSRRADLLPKTIASLKAGGFDSPVLFVDGDKDCLSWEREFGLPVTARPTRLRTHGNWVLSLYELYIREPSADRYAIFQDDLVTIKNLIQYLDSCAYPTDGYWNLYTFPQNQRRAPGTGGWYKSDQRGQGAVALVFDLEDTQLVLSHPHMVGRPTDPKRGHRAVDGGIVESFRKSKKFEYVHSPSLVQHTGDRSSMGNGPHPKALSFPGEEFDAVTLAGVDARS